MADVIKFDSNRGSVRIRGTKRFCNHQRHVIICQQTRTIECEECGAVVDPFDWVETWAKHGNVLDHQQKDLAKQVKRLTKILAILKRLEKNARTRVGRHVKLPDSWAIEQFVENKNWPW